MSNELSELTLNKTNLTSEIAKISREFKDMPSNLKEVDDTITAMTIAIEKDVFPNREGVSEVNRAYDAIVAIKPGADNQVSAMKCHMREFKRKIKDQDKELAMQVAREIATELKKRGANGDLADIVAGSIDVCKDAVSGKSPIGYNFAGYFDKTNEYGPTLSKLKGRIVGRMVENYTLKYPVSGKYDPIFIIEAACDPQDIKYDAFRRDGEKIHFNRQEGWKKTTWKCAIEEKKHGIKFATSGPGKKEWEETMTALLGKDQEIRDGLKHIQFNFSKAKFPERILKELERADNSFKVTPNTKPEKLTTELSKCIFDGEIIAEAVPAYLQDCLPRKIDQETLLAITAMVNNNFCRAIDKGHDIGATTYATINQLSSLICDVNNGV